MSAKVYNPMILSEMLRSPAVTRRPAVSTARITAARVKRDLFGPVDKEESKNFIESELAAQNEVLSKKWGFDFRSGEPLQSHDQYQWERVPPTSAPSCFVGGMVALTRAAHVVPVGTASENLLDQRAERENGNCFAGASSPAYSSGSSDTEMEPVRTHPLAKISLVAVAAAATAPASRSSSFPASVTRARRQQRITDFLKERKRLSPSAPKLALAKRARQMMDSASSSSSSSSSSQ